MRRLAVLRKWKPPRSVYRLRAGQGVETDPSLLHFITKNALPRPRAEQGISGFVLVAEAVPAAVRPGPLPPPWNAAVLSGG